MINVIIPVYKGVDLVSIALNSLVKQKLDKKEFLVTIIQDFDELDYSEVIEEYKNKGLNIDFAKAETRIKQGNARQWGIDRHPEADYIMFLDQDDEYIPDTMMWLYNKIKTTEADVVLSNFVKETKDGSEVVNQAHSDIITQLHGKIYSMEYVNRCNLGFSKELNYAEDSYFNLMAFHCTDKIGYVDRVTYHWNYNSNSESNFDQTEYFKNMYSDYVQGQIQALMHIHEYKSEIESVFIASLIIYFYNIAMVEKVKGYTNNKYIPYLKDLGKEEFIKKIFDDKDVMLYIANTVKGGQIFDEEPLFFPEGFDAWLETWLEK